MGNRDDKGRFLPGHSGGPGRPKKGDSFGEILEKHISDDELAAKLAELVRKNDMPALRYCIDRKHGKPIETLNQTIREVPEFVRFDDTDDTEDTEADSE